MLFCVLVIQTVGNRVVNLLISVTVVKDADETEMCSTHIEHTVKPLI